MAVLDTFEEMHLSRPIMKALTIMGYVKPTPIQVKTIPLALLGKDICGCAITGSGKTAAFVVPILERLLYRPKHIAMTRVLILTPTRELAIQCHVVATQLARFTDITMTLSIGGDSNKIQEAELRKKPDIIIATPGRLIDHMRNAFSFDLDHIDILVLDEADRMLDAGFMEEVTEIVRYCPKGRQTLLFSATMTDHVETLIKLSLHEPIRLFVNRSADITHGLTQEFIRIRETREAYREAVILALCCRTFKSKTIVFFQLKKQAHRMKLIFEHLGLKAAELHGDLTQKARIENLDQFKKYQVDYLLATDLAARGLDIAGIETVVNVHMPQMYNSYVHRVGRTARAGRVGRSVTLVGEHERVMLKQIIKNSPGTVKQRIIAPDVIEKFKHKLSEILPSIEHLLQQEKEERHIVETMQKVHRAENLLKHADEIQSRPARTWFQSKSEKKKLKTMQVSLSPQDSSSKVNVVSKRNESYGKKRRRLLS
jgi:ATP-dependent RNA helicase DDX27